MIIKISDNDYFQLNELIEIFDGCYVNDKEVTCFTFIKQMVNNRIELTSLNKNQKSNIKQQLSESKEWLISLNVSTDIIDKLIYIFV